MLAIRTTAEPFQFSATPSEAPRPVPRKPVLNRLWPPLPLNQRHDELSWLLPGVTEGTWPDGIAVIVARNG